MLLHANVVFLAIARLIPETTFAPGTTCQLYVYRCIHRERGGGITVAEAARDQTA